MRFHFSKGIPLAALSSATFGLLPLLTIPVLEAGVDLFSLCFYRFGIAAIVMGLYLVLKHKSLRVSAKDLMVTALLAMSYAATSLFLTHSYDYMPSGIATTIHFLYPVMVCLMMLVLFREKTSAFLIVAAALALCGVALLCARSGGNIAWQGIVSVLITVFTYASFIVGTQRSRVRFMDGQVNTFYILAWSAVYFFVMVCFNQGSDALAILPNMDSWVRVILLALLPTLISDMSLIYAIRLIGSTPSAILGCMEPLVAVIIGVFVFGESFGLLQTIGAIAVLASVLLVILNRRGKS